MSVDLKNVCVHYQGLTHQADALNWLQAQIPDSVLAEFALRWRSKVQITAELLAYLSLVKAPISRFSLFVAPLNLWMGKFGITERLEVAHFLAQLMHESGEMQYLEEIASGEAYEGRVDLGNTQPGDGKRYKGRGLIQLTGRANYADCSKALGMDFVANPTLLSQSNYAVASACWFWSSRGLKPLAMADDVEGVTRRINGGLNGFAERKQYLAKAKKALKV